MKKVSLSVLAILFAATSLIAKKQRQNRQHVQVVQKDKNAQKQIALIRKAAVSRHPIK
jgi:hypothetical protein